MVSTDTRRKRLRTSSVEEIDVDEVPRRPLISPGEDDPRYAEYKDGSIVRIRLENFVTYDAVECRPGPNLNMIIGPNGTGKSTIVCGIALGLAGKPELLGRAKKLVDFIKHGEESAMIEIELKRTGGNVTITRILQKPNSSAWRLNGASARESDVKRVIKELNAQVDNLCSFLPQDKVCEFAQMNAQELLRETERAIGDEDLLQQHDRLIALKGEEKRLKDGTEEHQKRLDVLKEKLAGLEEEVQRHQQRQKYLKDLRLIEGMILFKEYETAKEEYAAKKEEGRSKNEALEKANEKFAPLLKNLEEAKSKYAKQDAANAKLREEGRKMNEELRHALENDLSKLEDQVSKTSADIYSFEGRVASYKKKLETGQQELMDLQQEMDHLATVMMENGLMDENKELLNPPRPQGKLLELEEEDHEIAENIKTWRSEQRRLQNVEGELNATCQRLADKKRRIEAEMNKLNNLEEQKKSMLRKVNKDAYDAYEWLEQNRNQFQMPVYGPICLMVSAKDPRYAAAIENHVSHSVWSTFVALCKADYDRFNDEMADRQRKRINCVMFSHKTLADFPPEISREDLRRMGFDCHLLDCMDAPAEVLSALCQLSNIHRTPVTLGELRLDDLERDSRVVAFLDAQHRYQINRRYGETTTRCQTMKPPVMMTLHVDPRDVARLEKEMKEADDQLRAHEIKYKANAHELSENRGMVEKLEQKRTECKQKKQQILQLRSEFTAKQRGFDRKRNEVQSLESDLEGMDEEKEEAMRLLKKLLAKKLKLAKECTETQKTCARLLVKRTMGMLGCVDLEVVVEQLKAEKMQGDAQTAALTRELEVIQEVLRELKAKAKSAQEKVTAVISQYSDAERTEMRETYEETGLEDLRDQLVTMQVRADACPTVSGQTLAEYELRQREVADLEEIVAAKQGGLEQAAERMAAMKGEWHPRLQEMVERISGAFSSAFESIGCAGEVRLLEDEDFAQWGIEILIKFRDHEKLQVLTGHRQSGGERSVSTILYLMSLQQLSRTPFRVVDEINQGMDPRNERMVHEQLVDVACVPDTSQYFLITPKLLAELRYHERMKVLCVFNGEHQPGYFVVIEFLQAKRQRVM